MSSAPAEEPLSVTLLQQECRRLESEHVASLVSSDTQSVIVALAEQIQTSMKKFVRPAGESLTGRDFVGLLAVVFGVFDNMQRLLSMAANSQACTAREVELVSKSKVVEDPPLILNPHVVPSIRAFVAWQRELFYFQKYYFSCLAVRLPTIFVSAMALSQTEISAVILEVAIRDLAGHLVRLSSELQDEVQKNYFPPRPLQPLWGLLVTCAQLNWTWERLRALTETTIRDRRERDDSLSQPAVERRRSRVDVFHEGAVAFFDIQERLEVAHADQLAREVFLFSYDAINWKVSSAVPTVKSVAPFIWCLLFRCHDYALYGLTHGEDVSQYESRYVRDDTARRLIARVLQRTIDGVRGCLVRNAAGMHPERAVQLRTRDVPCLVLLARLWYLHLRPCPDLLAELHIALVRMVSTAVGLGNPPVVDDLNLTGGRARVEDEALHLPAATEETEQTEEEGEEVRKQRFLKVVWNVKPLQESEILMESVTIPWSSAFPRAEAVQTVLEGRVVVTTVK